MWSLILGLCCGWALPRQARADSTRLLLDVVLNAYPLHKICSFTLRDARLSASPEDLRDLGLRVPAQVPRDEQGEVALDALPNVSVRVDNPTQTLYLTADPSVMVAQVFSAGNRPASQMPTQTGLGLTLSYDLSGTAVRGQTAAQAALGVRAFSAQGVLTANWLVHVGSLPVATTSSLLLRLDTTWTHSDPQSLRSLRVGDFISGATAPSWVRSVRLGGLQFATDFTLRPDLVTFPVPVLAGAVAVPSTVEVLSNGAQALSRPVQAGPFQITQLAVINGAGQITMNITNALGQQISTTMPYYASASLLAPGLEDFSVEAGLVRRKWGLLSNDYGAAALSASWQKGLSNAVTAQAHAESAPGMAQAGVGAVVDLWQHAVANAGLSASGGHDAMLWSAGVQRQGSEWSLALSYSIAGAAYRDIAATEGDPYPRRELATRAGLSLGRFGSLGMGYTRIDPGLSPLSPGQVLSVPVLTRMLFVSYSVQMRAASVFATAYRDFVGGGRGCMLGVTLPLGPRSSVSASLGAGGERQLQATQSATRPGEWGYQVFDDAAAVPHAFSQVQYDSGLALVSAGVDSLAGHASWRSELRGALTWMDGGMFPSDPVADSFAVVDTGVSGIRVYDENREVGRTDADGRLLVPGLRAYDANHLAIEPDDVPWDATVSTYAGEVRPQAHAGVVVRLPVRLTHAALLTLKGDDGKPLPPGSVVKLPSSGETAVVGYDGQAYVKGLRAANLADVVLPDGHGCSLSFRYQAETGAIPRIGPLTCHRGQP